jgi:cytochrome oxidase Cu insertion factor (SCO1/SenC/PrrC family)
MIAIAGLSLAATLCAAVYGTMPDARQLDTTSSLATEFSDLRLRDQDDRPFDLTAVRGKVVLLNFVFTGCAATCPTQTRELAALQEALPTSLRRDVRFVSVSVDPLGDTPAALRAYGRSAGADFSSWTFATGRPQDIERLGERLRLFRDGAVAGRPEDHTTALWLLDGDGRLMQRYVDVDRPRLIQDLRQVRDLAERSG